MPRRNPSLLRQREDHFPQRVGEGVVLFGERAAAVVEGTNGILERRPRCDGVVVRVERLQIHTVAVDRHTALIQRLHCANARSHRVQPATVRTQLRGPPIDLPATGVGSCAQSADRIAQRSVRIGVHHSADAAEQQHDGDDNRCDDQPGPESRAQGIHAVD